MLRQLFTMGTVLMMINVVPGSIAGAGVAPGIRRGALQRRAEFPRAAGRTLR